MAWLNRILLTFMALTLAACGRHPSAVMPDGGGTGPVAAAEASMAVVDRPIATLASGPAVITATHYGDWPLWSQNRQYSASENAHYHFTKHGSEFGARSYEDWVAKVHAFIHAPPPGTQTLRRPNGDTLMYDPNGNVFAVMTKQGAPRTMFKPDNGAAYWRKQKQIEAGRRLGRDPQGED